MIKKTELIDKLGNVYADIMKVEINNSMSIEDCRNKFFGIMRKHGICQGTWSENGRALNNPEWNICWAAFKQHLIDNINWNMLFGSIPSDLMAYGKKPKTKKQIIK